MKVIVTSEGPEYTSDIAARFGRAPWFIAVDLDSGDREPIANDQNLNAAQGAGIQSAQTVVNSGAEVLLTGHCGPKAFRTLAAGGVRVFLGVSGTVVEAVERFRSGELDAAAAPDVESHWT
jgi:predicted Fe-Mo cluster-binding NifX family protein